MARARRPLTPEEIEDSARLRWAWDNRDPALGITNQTEMAVRCGWTTQGAFTQYLNGLIPLNLLAVARIATALKVAPSLLSPRLAAELPTSEAPTGSQNDDASTPATLDDVGQLSQAEIDLVLARRSLALHAPEKLDAIMAIVHEHARSRDPQLARWLGGIDLQRQRGVEKKIATWQIVNRSGAEQRGQQGAASADAPKNE